MSAIYNLSAQAIFATLSVEKLPEYPAMIGVEYFCLCVDDAGREERVAKATGMTAMRKSGHCKGNHTSPFHHTASMTLLVFSSSKSRVTATKHARRCVAAAVSRISTTEKAGLTWVLMYALLFFFSTFLRR